MSERSLDRFLPWLLAGAALAYLLPLRAQGLMILDDGWYLQPVMRMLDGEILYRDVWTFYAPGIHHVLEAIFQLTGPSILAARTLWVVLIAATAFLTYRFMRRFAPPTVAWLPAAVYLLVPGPWHKAYYATLAIAFFVVLARAFEKPGARRFAALGLLAGLTLATRQDLGLAEFGIALVAAPLPALFPTGFGRSGNARPALALRWSAAWLVAFAAPVAVTAIYYGAHGALADLVEAVFARGFGQMGAHPWLLWHVLAPATFAQAPEGRAVGVMMLSPLALYPALGVVLARRVLRDGVRADHALLGALLAFAAATLAQAYQPMLLLRLLQSALPFYLLATIAGYQACCWLRTREHPIAARFALAAPFVAGAAHVALVIFGIPALRQPIYTGSIRALAYQDPVTVLGETFYEEWGLVEQIRLVRAFYAEHAGADEPTMALPVHALYNAVLERRNPTRYLHDHPSGDFIMTAAQKRGEVERLLASPLRFAIVDQRWYAVPTPPDPLLAALREHFHPVRAYGSVLVLERGNDAAWRRFAAELRSAIVRGPAAFDAPALERFAGSHPEEPLAWRTLGLVRQSRGDREGAIDAFERAVALDPAEVAPLESIATLRAQQGERDAALDAVRRARKMRDSETLRGIAASLGAP